MGILERIPEIACLQCKGELEEDEHLRCVVCGKVYEIQDGIAQMLGDDAKAFAREIAVQDRVACEYEQKRYENPYAKRYHDWWTEQMLSRVRTNGRILDNGCGIGLLFDKVRSGQVVGLDISSEMLKVASKKSDRLIRGNSQQLPLKDNSFDVVFCRSLIHHLPRPELAVREIVRILRPEGQAVFVDTNTSLLSALPRKIANLGGHFSEEHKNLNRSKMERLLKPHLRVEEVMYFGYIAYPLLGFPDIINLFKFVPFKSIAERMLMFIDNALSRIPFIRTQSWAILVKAVKLPAAVGR